MIKPATPDQAKPSAIITWTEHLRCPRCAKTGDAELFEISQFNNGFQKVPDGFRVVVGQYGAEFYCTACGNCIEGAAH